MGVSVLFLCSAAEIHVGEFDAAVLREESCDSAFPATRTSGSRVCRVCSPPIGRNLHVSLAAVTQRRTVWAPNLVQHHSGLLRHGLPRDWQTHVQFEPEGQIPLHKRGEAFLCLSVREACLPPSQPFCLQSLLSTLYLPQTSISTLTLH